MSQPSSTRDTLPGHAKQRAAGLLLLLSPLIWGATFPAAKVALDHGMTVLSFTAWSRLLGVLAAVSLLAVWRPPPGSWPRALIPAGLLLGALLTGGYLLQTFGIERTTATNAGFITVLYVVWAPLGFAVLRRTAPDPIAWVCVPLALVGLGLLSLQGWRLHWGDTLVLAGSIVFAAHIVAVAVLVERFHPLALGIAQLAGAAVLQLLLAVPGGMTPHAASTVVGVLILTGVLGSGVAFTIQVVAQRDLSPLRTSLLLAGEAVFAAIT